MSEPRIYIPNQQGYHNSGDLKKFKHRDLSTLVVVPCYSRGIHPLVVQNWRSLIQPMNQRVMWIFLTDMEVGAAYSHIVRVIREHPDLKKYKYMLTIEHDNLPPPDGMLKLYDSMEQGYDAVGGLYFTKGLGGQPMCYGRVDRPQSGFEPWLPGPDEIVPCRGLGMGFTMFRTEMLLDKKLGDEPFKTVQEYISGVGARAYTQDLWFFQEAGKLGYRFACDARVKVGHLDLETSEIW